MLNPYSCCIANCTSTKARESRPMSSKLVSGSSLMSASLRPTRSTRIRLRSSKVNVCCAAILRPPDLGGHRDLLERRQALGGRLPAGLEEQVGEVEVAPAPWAEARCERHVGHRRVAD